MTGAVVFAANNVPLNTNTLSGGVALANYSLDPADTDVIVVRYVYTFEGNAQDSSGNAIHGTATSVSYVTGKFRVLVP